MLYSIDSHNNIEMYGVDSYTELKMNLCTRKLEEFVHILKQTSKEAAQHWHCHNVKMLFIDADHSYEKVKEDFTLWEPFTIEHGLIALHDSDEAGPQQVIEEAMETQQFHKLLVADSLTVLRKLNHAAR